MVIVKAKKLKLYNFNVLNLDILAYANEEWDRYGSKSASPSNSSSDSIISLLLVFFLVEFAFFGSFSEEVLVDPIAEENVSISISTKASDSFNLLNDSMLNAIPFFPGFRSPDS